jgi:rhodanese-related sulfurtransferase
MMTRNRILAIVALVLGAFAVLGNPYQGSVVSINTQELATIVESKVDHVTVEELASWIIQGDTEYRLVDVREEVDFAEYHIPSAENVLITDLADYPLYRNEKIVLYSDGGIHSAQAWFLLKAKGYHGAYILFDGLNAWKDEILFPSLPADATPEEQASFERARFVSEFFGGTPRTGVTGEIDEAAVPMPTIDAPARKVAPTRKKKKRKAC